MDISRGEGNPVTDTPGIYGLNNSNDEERLTEALLSDADVIINVVDGTSLRDCTDIAAIGTGVPMVVLVNMMDECAGSNCSWTWQGWRHCGRPGGIGAAATGGMAELGQVVKL